MNSFATVTLLSTALLGSPGASALLGPGVLLLPAVVALLIILMIIVIATNKPFPRLLGLLFGFYAALTAAVELLGPFANDFGGWFGAWLVTGSLCALLSGALLWRDRKRKPGDDASRAGRS